MFEQISWKCYFINFRFKTNKLLSKDARSVDLVWIEMHCRKHCIVWQHAMQLQCTSGLTTDC